jgi:hypothetical protein
MLRLPAPGVEDTRGSDGGRLGLLSLGPRVGALEARSVAGVAPYVLAVPERGGGLDRSAYTVRRTLPPFISGTGGRGRLSRRSLLHLHRSGRR